MMRSPTLPLLENCIPRRVYKLRSRNLSLGVYNGRSGFIGIRTKFGDRFLFTEYHWDTGSPYGTVMDAIDTGIDVSEDIPLIEYLGSEDINTGRLVDYSEDKRWYWVDTGESDPDIRACAISNQPLFNFLRNYHYETENK